MKNNEKENLSQNQSINSSRSFAFTMEEEKKEDNSKEVINKNKYIPLILSQLN